MSQALKTYSKGAPFYNVCVSVRIRANAKVEATACSRELGPHNNARNYLFSALHRNGDGLRKLKRQLSLGSERGYVFVLLVIGRRSAPGIALGLAFVRGTNRVGFQFIRLSADYDGR